MDLAHLNDRGLVLVGCGRMGGALLQGWLARGLAPKAVHVIDPRVPAWVAERGISTEGAGPADPAVIVLAVGHGQVPWIALALAVTVSPLDSFSPGAG